MLTPNFTCTQTLGVPGSINFVDLSTGSDILVVSRRIYILTANGSYLVESGNPLTYSLWPVPLSTGITLAVLTQDTAPSIRVDYMNAGGAILYSKTIPFSFTLNTEQFYYTLTQTQTSSPSITQDTNYYNNKMILRVNIDSANQAISFAGDIYSAQAALDRATYMINNENDFF